MWIINNLANDANSSEGAQRNVNQIVKFFKEIGYKEKGIQGREVSLIIKENNLSVAQMEEGLRRFKQCQYDG